MAEAAEEEVGAVAAAVEEEPVQELPRAVAAMVAVAGIVAAVWTALDLAAVWH